MRVFIRVTDAEPIDDIVVKLRTPPHHPFVDVIIGNIALTMQVPQYMKLREALWKYKPGMGDIDPDAEERANTYSDMIANAYEAVYGEELDGEEGEEEVLKRGLGRLKEDAKRWKINPDLYSG